MGKELDSDMNKKKLPFGNRELMAVVIITILYVLVEHLEVQLVGNRMIEVDAMAFIHVAILLLTLSSAIFGPVVGVICSVAGSTISYILFEGRIDYIMVANLTIYAYMIGRYYRKLGVLEGKFKGISIIDYSVIVIIAGIVTTVLFRPLAAFVIFRDNLLEGIRMGTSWLIWGALINIVAGTPIMHIISTIISKKNN